MDHQRSKILFLSLPGFAVLAAAQAPTIGNCSVFPADNIWNTPVDSLPVSPNSSTWINTIGATTGVHADFGSGLWDGAPIGIPFVTVPGSQTKYPATFTYQDESDPGPYAIPLDAPIEGGSSSSGDRHAIAIDTGNCILYEIYAAYPQSASWQGGSGAIFNLTSDALRPATWTSADAAGLPIFPGLVRWDEVASGQIRHAIRFTVPQTQKAYAWPARHYASNLTSTQYPPMGARFRLRASFNISGYSTTNQVILRAMQKYGIMLADNGSSWYISGEPNANWDNDDLHLLGNIKGTDWEAVDVTPLMITADSGQAIQPGISVTVNPPAASVQAGSTQQFTATVNGTTNQGVTWDVNGNSPGNAQTGTITAGGLFTAPATVPSSGSVTIHATSQANTSEIGSASVTITPAPPPPPVSITISPVVARVPANSTLQFSAHVSNTTNTAVTWAVSGAVDGSALLGTISSSGLYQAPLSVQSPFVVTITATSAADPTKSARALVTVSKSGNPGAITSKR